ncbi:MAG TPA: arabinan endo-1,5-alpha-L-arabinosidase [Gemmatirosa sp.]
MLTNAARCARRLAAGLALLLPAAGRVASAQVGDVRDVPDPAVIKDGNAYYVYATGEGIPIRRSTDLVHWTRIGRVFPGATPAWAQRVIPGTQYPWAPDISFINGRYHLYYALSTFGGQHSAIALATNVTLDPSNPRYRWEDRGVILESHPGSTFNAIDPAAIVDEQGTPWLTWGSFWGGIKLRRLDPATGKVSSADTTIYSIAARAGTDATQGPRDAQAIEGPYLVKHGGYYYLFVSFDKCCEGARSNYNVRVGRSRTITGPYVDRDSVPMTQGGGTLVLASYGVVRGPGHNSVLTDGDRYYIVHHYINANEGPASPDAPLAIPRSLEIRPMYWAWGGWPVAGEPLTPPAVPAPAARTSAAPPRGTR